MFIKPKELAQYVNTDNSGSDKFNPKIYDLPKSYKLALYLGYSVKWDHDYRFTDIWNKNKFYFIDPVFKKSYDRYDNWYFHNNWNSLFDVVIPKLKADNLLTDEIKESVFNCDQHKTLDLILKVIDKHVKDIKSPFTILDKLGVKEYYY